MSAVVSCKSHASKIHPANTVKVTNDSDHSYFIFIDLSEWKCIHPTAWKLVVCPTFLLIYLFFILSPNKWSLFFHIYLFIPAFVFRETGKLSMIVLMKADPLLCLLHLQWYLLLLKLCSLSRGDPVCTRATAHSSSLQWWEAVICDIIRSAINRSTPQTEQHEWCVFPFTRN